MKSASHDDVFARGEFPEHPPVRNSRRLAASQRPHSLVAAKGGYHLIGRPQFFHASGIYTKNFGRARGKMIRLAASEIWGQCAPVMDKNLGRNAPHALRIRRLWAVQKFPTSAAFARHLGVDPKRLNNVENGYPLGRDLAERIVQRIPGITLDWLWYGKTEGLSVQVARELELIPSGKETTRSS